MRLPFALADWIVIALYGLVLVAGGWLFVPRRTATARDYFLAGGTVPAWLAAVSVLSATQSAATFLGVPDYGYRGDYAYLASTIGALLGALVVARVLIPRFYAMGATTAYELLGRRYGGGATRWAGAMFLGGRVLAGGARVYLAAIALAMVVTGGAGAAGVIAAAAALMAASFLFTFHGGLRSVLWNDLLQFAVFLGAALAVLAWLRASIPVPTGALVHALAHAPGGADKLRLLDLSVDPARPFTLVAVLTGGTLLAIGNAGLDQDTTQRLLACRDARTGARGLYLSVLATVPVVALFLTIGVLLSVFYDRPELTGHAGAAVAQRFGGERVSVFMAYILTEVPPGLRGLVTAGVTAAAIATTNSALNAMSAVAVQDFYRPWREARGGAGERHYVRAGRVGMGLTALAMFGCAVLSYWWQHHTRAGLLEFALGVMVFSYAGLLGVYGIALFTTRGSAGSVVAALAGGFVATLLLQPGVARAIGLPGALTRLAYPYQLCLATAVAAAICALPRGRPLPPPRMP